MLQYKEIKFIQVPKFKMQEKGGGKQHILVKNVRRFLMTLLAEVQLGSIKVWRKKLVTNVIFKRFASR